MNTATTTTGLYGTSDNDKVYYVNKKGTFLIVSPKIWCLDDICRVNNLPLDARPVTEDYPYPDFPNESVDFCDILGETIPVQSY
jgi:hypothetical protein